MFPPQYHSKFLQSLEKMCFLPCSIGLLWSLIHAAVFQLSTWHKLNLLEVVSVHSYSICHFWNIIYCATYVAEIHLRLWSLLLPLWISVIPPCRHHQIAHHLHRYSEATCLQCQGIFLHIYWQMCFSSVAQRMYGLGPDPKVTLVKRYWTMFLSLKLSYHNKRRTSLSSGLILI